METGKTDRRVQYTKRALTSALIDLMRENHISKISVKALCAAADVNRSTFYAHFRNQYDLLAYIEAEALEDLKARLLADGEPRTRNVEKILEYAKENADVFLMLLDESEGGFQQQIMELAHLVDLQMSDQDAAVDADDLEYMYLFAVSGALGMLSHWLKKGTPQSPAEMSELLMSMIQHGVEERA
ncbi:TetR/AcrR family transcriptional regulator [Eggerthella lenta]|uniref:TetR/AcrR family transcriptional regulator n=1 Tax=Eggerthella lenta TaxID=84112 RepID=UPI00189CEAD7|nr:TetR/AcrR family transcriptional regulator [Eggerthella lenta]MDB1787855.1 TetR/AcrR family transcriptional regulator [Eggerthella lenta]